MHRKKINVLLVEDDPGDCRRVKLSLAKAQLPFEFVVETAESLEQGLACFSNQRFDLALLDLALPGSRGFETVDKFSKARPSIPFVVLAGLNDEEAGFEAIRRGASDYLIKGKAYGDLLVRTIWHSLERKKIELQLLETKQQLEKANKKLASSKEYTALLSNETITAAKSKSEFLANMSHEMRTPMGNIKNMIELVLDSGNLNEDDYDYLCTAKTSVTSLLQLINDILDISKIESDGLDIEFIHCDVREILDAVLNLRLKAMDKGLDFDLVFKTAVPQQIKTDSRRLIQCLTNLASNAVKFTEAGGVTIQISLQYKGTEPFIRFDVIDTGIGIPFDKQSEILGMFAQADSSATRRYGGTGLGLAITKQLTEMLGGELTITSQTGKGSTFSLLVPANVDVGTTAMLSSLDRQMKETGGNKQSIRDYKLSGNILVAEDDLANQKGIKAILERGGLKVEMATNGLEAVDEVTSGSYDLVLMDMQMPKMNGYEATNTLRKKGFDLPIIALTANAMKGDLEKCRKAGCDAYLSKPADIPKLFELLGAYLPSKPDELVDEIDRVKDEVNQLSKEVSDSSKIAGHNYSKKELEAKIEELLDVDHRKNDFLANMSHDIRTPLNGVVSLIELALDEDDLGKKVHDYLSSAKRSANSLLYIINDILDISKIEAGKLDIEPVDSSIAEILVSVDSIIRAQAAEKGIDFNIVLKTAIPEKIRTDPTRVHQCLINLAGNAVKFTKIGSVTIEVSLGQRDGNGFVRFDVIDTGIGIPADKQTCIFSKFSQADISISRKYGGTGLGLAIVKQLSNLLGGDLTLVSESGKGSTFSLLIPANVDFASAPMITDFDSWKEVRQCSKSAFSNYKFTGNILIAEDDSANRKGIQAVMEKIGLNTEIARDGLEAVEKVTGGSYDLVLMDIQMPNMNGYDATRLLRKKGFDLPIIALTANAMKGDTEKCLEAGCDAYMAKPIELDKLFATLDKFLQPQSKDMAQESDVTRGEVERFGDDNVVTEIVEAWFVDNSKRILALAEAVEASSSSVKHQDDEQYSDQTINWSELEERFGDDEVVTEIVEAWFVDNPDRIAALSGAIEAGNVEEVQALSHTLKGSAALIGARRLFTPVLKLNRAARNGSLENADILLESIQAEFEKLKLFVSKPNWTEIAKQECGAGEQAGRV